jgi:hypothetical protein
MGLLAPVQFAAAPRPRLVIQAGLEPSGEEPFAHLGDGHGRRMQPGGNRLGRVLLISEKQRIRPANRASSSITLLNEGIELTAFMFA